MTPIKKLKIIIFFLVFLNLISCNHLFYYPDSNIWLTPQKLKLEYKEVTIKVNENVQVFGWVIRNKMSKTYGTVNQFHGNAGNISTHFLYLSWLVNHGYDLFIFDYPGYGKSSGEAIKEDIFKDSKLVLEWVQNNIDTKNLFLLGQSLGGAVLVPVYTESKINNVRGVILDSTFSSYRYITREKLASIWLTWPFQWPLGFLVSDDYSPINYIRKISVPIINFHSELDPVVSFTTGNLLFEEANEPKQLYKLINSGHCEAFIMNDDQYRRRLLEFLCENLADNNNLCKNDLKKLENSYIKSGRDAYNEILNQK